MSHRVPVVIYRLPRQLLPIVLVHTWVIFPSRYEDIEKSSILFFAGGENSIQNSGNASVDWKIRIIASHLGLQPLFFGQRLVY